TATLVLFLIYSAYLLARAMADELDEQAARFAAIFAIIGALDIPLIMMSVRWWRTLHPQPIVLRGGEGPAMPPEMLAVLLISFIGIGTLAAWLTVLRSETEWMAKRTAALRAVVDRHEGA
ncbi:MAG: cytochrome C assembly protein, partial [Chloroflexi bacterium]|nr:cytochrome C assembly protein [Chloroflexota bacterium]